MRRVLAGVGLLVVVAIAVPLLIAVLRDGGTGDIRPAAPSNSAASSPPPVEAMYTPPGQCITLAAQPAGLAPRRVDCAADEVTFVVARSLPATGGRCGAGPYSQITRPGFGTLCVVPNLAQGACYSVPGAGGTLGDYRRTACDARPVGTTQIIRVAERASAASVDCVGGQVVAFTEPTPLAYCLVRPD